MERNGENYKSASELACNATPEEVDRFAAEVARELKFAPGGDATKVVAMLGGRLSVQNIVFEEGNPNTIYVHGPNDFDIVLAMTTSSRRDRFTIAHELGHYFLHSLQGEHKLKAARSGENEPAEWEADWFAGGFLMPKAEFLAYAKMPKASRSSLAERFAVSEAAIKVRARVLGVTLHG